MRGERPDIVGTEGLHIPDVQHCDQVDGLGFHGLILSSTIGELWANFLPQMRHSLLSDVGKLLDGPARAAQNAQGNMRAIECIGLLFDLFPGQVNLPSGHRAAERVVMGGPDAIKEGVHPFGHVCIRRDVFLRRAADHAPFWALRPPRNLKKDLKKANNINDTCAFAFQGRQQRLPGQIGEIIQRRQKHAAFVANAIIELPPVQTRGLFKVSQGCLGIALFPEQGHNILL
jgi:hypothetical protein